MRSYGSFAFRGLNILRWFLVTFFLLFAFPILAIQLPTYAPQTFLDPEEAFVFNAAMKDPKHIEIYFHIKPGYYLYRERISISFEKKSATILGVPEYSKSQSKYDATFDKNMEVYHNSATIRLSLSPSDQSQHLIVRSQGCAEAGLCYPPIEHSVDLVPIEEGYQILGYAAESPSADRSSSSLSSLPILYSKISTLFNTSDVTFAQSIKTWSLLEILPIFWILGLLLAFTPCVLPMVPILSAVILGTAHGKAVSKLQGLGLAAAYVFGMSIIYTALGILAGLSGASLAATLQTPWALGIFATILSMLALAMFGAFTFQMPVSLQNWLSEHVSRFAAARPIGAFMIGVLSALVIGPCLAAPLAGVLIYISHTQNILVGGLALFSLAWGMGTPILLWGATFECLLPKVGPWMEGIKQGFGLLLLMTAWWLLGPVLPIWTQMLGWAFFCFVVAVMIKTFETPALLCSIWRQLGRALGILLMMAGGLLMVGLASGGRSVLEPLKHWVSPTTQIYFQPVSTLAALEKILSKSTRPIMLNFYADWCVACHEMEKFTFSDPTIAKRLSALEWLKVDVTKSTAENTALLKRFHLFGPPGIIFFDAQGREIEGGRIVGYQSPKDLTLLLDRILH